MGFAGLFDPLIPVAKKRQKTRKMGWEAFLKQPTRTECAESTEKKYEGQFRIFTEWVAKEHPEI